MRPQRNAGEYRAYRAQGTAEHAASMRPQRNAGEYELGFAGFETLDRLLQ